MASYTASLQATLTLETFLRNHNTLTAHRGPAHELLKPFAGEWTVEGHNASMEDAVHGQECYQWFEGEYFLMNRWNRPSSKGDFRGQGWIGYDFEDGLYRSYSISNLGFFRVYTVNITANEIIYLGAKERGVVQLHDQATSMTIKWEQNDNGRWKPLCDLHGQKLTS